MKKTFTLLLILGLCFGLSNNIHAQQITDPDVEITIGKEESLRNRTVLVPVSAEVLGDEVFRSFEFFIRYDTSVLEFQDIVEIHPFFVTVDYAPNPEDPPGAGVVNANLKIFWEIPTNTPNTTDEFDDTMFYLEFYFFGNASDIEFLRVNEEGLTEVGGGPFFSPQEVAVKDINGQDFIVEKWEGIFVDGRVSEIFPPVPLANWPIFLGIALVLGFIAVRFGRVF